MPLPEGEGWSTARAEEAISAVAGVLSVRVNDEPEGQVSEIHVLATAEVPARQIVSDIEAALFVHFGLNVDRRRISVAQTSGTGVGRRRAPREPDPPEEQRLAGRMVLLGHQLVGERPLIVNVRVNLEWKGRRFQGSAAGADVAQSRLEALATATLRAVENAAESELGEMEPKPVSLHLDGVTVVPGLDQPSVLVSINAVSGRETTPLAGAVGITESKNRAVILATLQATDRWIRGQIRS